MCICFIITHLHAKLEDDLRRTAAGRTLTISSGNFPKNVVTMTTMTLPTHKTTRVFALTHLLAKFEDDPRTVAGKSAHNRF